MKKIEIRPIVKESWHKKQGEENFTRAKKIRALVDSDTNLYCTGLTDKDIKDLEKRGVTYDLSPNFRYDQAHPFWDSNVAAIKLENRPQFLYPETKPLDAIHLSIIKASKFVANSLAELEEGFFPDATHVIIDSDVLVQKKASKVKVRNSAIIAAQKLSASRQKALILVLSGKNCRSRSADFTATALDEIIEKDAEKVLEFIALSKEDLEAQALVLEALQKNIFRKDGHKIMYQESVLGVDVSNVVEYLDLPANQDLKIRVLEQITK